MSTITGGSLVFNYSSFLQSSLNLYDVPDKALARQNLGIVTFSNNPLTFGSGLLPGTYDGTSPATIQVNAASVATFSSLGSLVSNVLTCNALVINGTNFGWSSSGDIHANSIYGDGSHLTGLTASQISGLVTSYLSTTSTQPQSVASPVTFNGSVSVASGQHFIGDGSQLTGLTKLDTQTTAAQSVASAVTFNGSVSVAPGQHFVGDGSQLTGLTKLDTLTTTTQSVASMVNFAQEITAYKFAGDGSLLTGITEGQVQNLTTDLSHKIDSLLTTPQSVMGDFSVGGILHNSCFSWNFDNRNAYWYESATQLGLSGWSHFDYEAGAGFWNTWSTRNIQASGVGSPLCGIGNPAAPGCLANFGSHTIVVHVDVHASVSPAYNFSLATMPTAGGSATAVFSFGDVCAQTELLYNSGAGVIFQQSNQTQCIDNDRAFKPVHWSGYVTIPPATFLGIYHTNAAANSNDSYALFLQFSGHYLYVL